VKTLRLILGDQLNHQHSWLSTVNDEITYTMMEVRSETDYVRHHIQKVAAFFLAMRAFADHLEKQGHQVIYLKLGDPEHQHTFAANLDRLIDKHGFERFAYQLPDEYRLDEMLKDYAGSLAIPSEAVDTEHFYTNREALRTFFKGKKTYILESFYRNLRRQEGVLMEDGEPATGRWNYDAENRNKLKGEVHIPHPPVPDHDASEVIATLEAEGVATIGRMAGNRLAWPVTRKEGLVLLEFFCERLLPHFGEYQDAMIKEHAFLFHSRLSFAMNVKLLSPAEVVNAVEECWMQDPERYAIAQVEGFIRQVLGWREYMRGVYWAKMPGYASLNALNQQASLPEWFWTGKTKMSCLAHAIDQSLDHAYAHHIQRLMVTGNFALLLGVHPDEVDAWYLGIYIDALEWVEITNTRGMSQFADGGIVGTKPYVSSANYIHKMSNYCKGCYYDRKVRAGEKACPFNSLYWDFYDRNREQLAKNPRIGMAYRTWDKMDGEKRSALLEQAEYYKEHAETL